MAQLDTTSREAAPVGLTEVFRRVRRASTELSELDAALVRCVACLNAGLRRFATTRVLLLLPEEFGSRRDPSARAALTFARRDGRWEMLIERGSFGRDGRFNQRECVPVRLASRQVRVELLRDGHARALVERVVSRAQRERAS